VLETGCLPDVLDVVGHPLQPGDRPRVRCLVRAPFEAPLLEVVGPSVEPVVGDVRDPVAVARLFDGVGAGATVFHAAAVIHPERHVRELYDVNVGGAQLVVDGARRAEAGRFVHVSSNSPFGANARPTDRFTEDSAYAPYLGYGRSKMEAEQIVARSHERGDVPTVIVRAPWFYGPFQPARQTRFFAAIRRGRFPLVGDGTQQRSMVYSGNLVDGDLKVTTDYRQVLGEVVTSRFNRSISNVFPTLAYNPLGVMRPGT